MSFSSEVKEELSRQTDSARHCRIAFLAAMFHLSPVLTGDRAGIRTDQESAAAAFESVLRRVVSCPVEVERSRQGSGGQIRVTVSGRQEVRNLLEMLKLDRGAEGEILTQEEAAAMIPSRLLLQKTCCRRAYLRGAFLLAGSVSDPSKSYHFEIVFQREEDAEIVRKALTSDEFCRYVKLIGKNMAGGYKSFNTAAVKSFGIENKEE
jgi:DNA-binding protein WhiA